MFDKNKDLLALPTGDWELTGIGIFRPKLDITAHESAVIMSCFLHSISLVLISGDGAGIKRTWDVINSSPELKRHFAP